jgi:putative PIN family toxin of toxin-antitoxin system
MTRVVLDANTLASGAITTTGTLASIIDAWRNGKYTVIVSEPILVELERTLQKPYFQQRLTNEQSSRFITLLRKRAILSPITISVHGVATHPEDDLILATALSAKANYLVTGDAKLQKLGTYSGVRILSPRAFLDILLSIHK